MPIELKDWVAVDLPGGGPEWEPGAREDVWFVVEFNVGDVGEAASDLFQVMVATPESLRALRHRGGRPHNAKILLMEGEVSWEAVVTELRRVVESCDEGNMRWSIDKLRKHFQWEYENYRG